MRTCNRLPSRRAAPWPSSSATHGLRQQQYGDVDEQVFNSLADFVAPKNAHGKYYNGVCAGFGVETLVSDIRPVPSYPSQPDPNVAVIWKLMHIGNNKIEMQQDSVPRVGGGGDFARSGFVRSVSTVCFICSAAGPSVCTPP